MKAERLAFLKAFENGELARLTELSSEEAHRAKSLDLAIWAHSLSGDLQKALWHYTWIESRGLKLSATERAVIHFALGVAHTRVSEYAKARQHFARNHALSRENEHARFFLLQGLGFYRFFTGDYVRSSKYAEAAFEASSQLKFKFGQLLAEELLAHTLIECGQIRRGMRHMRNALERARQLDHSSLRKSFRLILLLNEARFNLENENVERLEKALGKLRPQDIYSLNAVKLELANQYLLRGKISRAYRILDEACDSIYASQNRRQIALLNFRLAFLTWLRGGHDEALHLLKSAELQLHKDVDTALLLKMRGLRDRILDRVPEQNPRSEFGIHSRVLRRSAPNPAAKETAESAPIGEDRLGDLADGIYARDPHALQSALEHKLYYFLYAHFGLRFKQKAFVFDLLPKGVLVIDHGDINIIEHGLTRVLRRILELLAVSHQSKAELVRLAWGYEYESLRHDPLVYTSISKLRQVLGPAGAWIEMDEKGYRLQSGVVLQNQRTVAVQPEKKIPVDIIPLVTNPRLSFRQLRILSGFDSPSKDIVGVDDVMRDFQVSRATATRDLTELTAEGFLRRIGRARATRYARTLKQMGES